MKRFSLILILGGLLGNFIVPLSPISAQGPQSAACPREDSPGCTHGLPTAHYTQLLAEMQANPVPIVEPIPVDTKLVNTFTFFKILPGAQRFDAPNGNVIASIDDGFNFVSIYGAKDGFGKMRDGTWIPLNSLKKTFASEFSGIMIKQPLKYPIAWVIQSSITSAIPGGVRRAGAPVIKRYTLVYIYETVRTSDGWDWYLVAPGQWLEQRKVARVDPFLLPKNAPTGNEAKKWVAVDLYEQTLKFYENNTLVAATLISSGLPPWNTNPGSFKVWQRAEQTPMSGAMGQPDAYSLPAVPYVMFFDKEISLHGTYWHDGFGFKRSHGCVNMSISDAHWLFDWAGTDDLTVVVWDSRNMRR